MAMYNPLEDAINNGGITPFYLGCASTQIPGLSSINKFGRNGDIDTAGPEDIWDYGGVYVFSTSADIDKISSSTGDTSIVEIQGLDGNYNYVSQNVTLVGTSSVTLTTPLMRVFRMKNVGSTDLVGGIYLYTSTGPTTAGVPDNSSDVRAFINNGNNQTLMAIYTVPAGKTAYMTRLVTTLGRSITATASMKLKIREPDGVFNIKRAYQMNNSQAQDIREYGPYLRIPEKSDIVVSNSTVSANNVIITAEFDLILKDN